MNNMSIITSMEEVYNWGQLYHNYNGVNVHDNIIFSGDGNVRDYRESDYSHEFIRDNANFICGVIDTDPDVPNDLRPGIAVITLNSIYYVVLNLVSIYFYNFDNMDDTTNILCLIPLDENTFSETYCSYSSEICDLFLQHVLTRDLVNGNDRESRII